MTHTFIVFAGPAFAVDIFSVFAAGPWILEVNSETTACIVSNFMFAAGSPRKLNGIRIFRRTRGKRIWKYSKFHTFHRRQSELLLFNVVTWSMQYPPSVGQGIKSLPGIPSLHSVVGSSGWRFCPSLFLCMK